MTYLIKVAFWKMKLFTFPSQEFERTSENLLINFVKQGMPISATIW